MPIPEADLAAKRELIKKGQAHRKFRQDPADKPPQTDGQDQPPRRRHQLTVCYPAPRSKKRTAPATASTPLEDTRTVESRPDSPSSRRIMSCTVDLGSAWYAPTTTTTGTGITTGSGGAEPPFFGREPGLAPPPESSHLRRCRRLDFHWLRISHRQWRMMR